MKKTIVYKRYRAKCAFVETTQLPRSSDFEFDSILAPYAALLPSPQPDVMIPSRDQLLSSEGHLAHPKKDAFAGLY